MNCDSSDEDLVINIEGKRYVLPKEVKEKEHTHRKKKNWVSMWFYKNRKKTRVFKKDVKNDYIITATRHYRIRKTNKNNKTMHNQRNNGTDANCHWKSLSYGFGM